MEIKDLDKDREVVKAWCLKQGLSESHAEVVAKEWVTQLAAFAIEAEKAMHVFITHSYQRGWDEAAKTFQQGEGE